MHCYYVRCGVGRSRTKGRCRGLIQLRTTDLRFSAGLSEIVPYNRTCPIHLLVRHIVCKHTFLGRSWELGRAASRRIRVGEMGPTPRARLTLPLPTTAGRLSMSLIYRPEPLFAIENLAFYPARREFFAAKKPKNAPSLRLKCDYSAGSETLDSSAVLLRPGADQLESKTRNKTRFLSRAYSATWQ